MNRVSLIKYAVLFYLAGSVSMLGVMFRRKTFTRLFFFLSASVLLILSVTGYAFGIEPYWIRVHTVAVHDPVLARTVSGLTIAQITDVHITRGLGFREKQLIRKMNALHPDIILFTGDLMDDLQQVPAAQLLIKSLHAKIGIFGIPGDTDQSVMSDAAFARAFTPSGLEIIAGRVRPVQLPSGNTLWLAGASADGFSPKMLAAVPSGAPVVMLTHSPAVFDAAVKAGINLVLAGDTHGGQVGIPFLVRLSRYAYRGPYMKGTFKRKGTLMSISNGIGTKSIPVRFLCPPEISLIKVRP